MEPFDIDWSDCPLVQRHPDYLGGALAMRSSPRMSVEGLIANYTDGCSVEEAAAMFEVDVEEVRAIIRYYVDRVPAQIIAAALAPPARTLTITDDTIDEELSAFIRGKPYP